MRLFFYYYLIFYSSIDICDNENKKVYSLNFNEIIYIFVAHIISLNLTNKMFCVVFKK